MAVFSTGGTATVSRVSASRPESVVTLDAWVFSVVTAAMSPPPAMTERSPRGTRHPQKKIGNNFKHAVQDQSAWKVPKLRKLVHSMAGEGNLLELRQVDALDSGTLFSTERRHVRKWGKASLIVMKMK